MRKQGDRCRNHNNAQTHQRYPTMLGCCRRPLLLNDSWEGRESFREGGGPHIGTAVLSPAAGGTSCKTGLDG